MHFLKKYTLLFFASLFLALASCGGDDEGTDPINPGSEFEALKIGGSGNEESLSTKDGDGNIIIAGSFNGTATFGTIQHTSIGSGDIFIAKYDSKGNLLWSKRAGGLGYDTVLGICVDSDGDIYITGQTAGESTFEDHTIEPNAGYYCYLTKYTSAGNVTYVRYGAGPSEDEGSATGFDIAVDDAQNVYVVGSISGVVNFNSVQVTSSGSGNYDAFIAKYNNGGEIEWARTSGGVSVDEAVSVAVHDNGVLVAGNFRQSANFSSTSLTSSGLTDIFLARYTTDGDLAWVKKAGGIKEDYANDVSVNGIQGAVIFSGSFHNEANFGGLQLTAAGTSDDGFVAKYSANGDIVWANAISGTTNLESVMKIFVDESENIYATGSFNSTSITDGVHTLNQFGGSDIFVVKYSLGGEPLWLKGAGSTGTDSGKGISADADGNVFVTGTFSGTVKFGETELVSSGAQDVFLWKFKQ